MSLLSRFPLKGWPLGLLISSVAVAQPPGSAPGLFDPAQLPSFEGKVQQFTLTPRGDIDGFILIDGTEVKTPPHLSTSIAYAVEPGDSVTIHGMKAAAIALIQAASLTDNSTHRTIVDQGPEPRPGGPRAVGAVGDSGLTQVQGIIRMSLHGAAGEINGAVLTDGTQLRVPPDAAATLSNFLQPGKTIVAEGEKLTSPLGNVLEVQNIGSSRTDLTATAVCRLARRARARESLKRSSA